MKQFKYRPIMFYEFTIEKKFPSDRKINFKFILMFNVLYEYLKYFNKN